MSDLSEEINAAITAQLRELSKIVFETEHESTRVEIDAPRKESDIEVEIGALKQKLMVPWDQTRNVNISHLVKSAAASITWEEIMQKEVTLSDIHILANLVAIYQLEPSDACRILKHYSSGKDEEIVYQVTGGRSHPNLPKNWGVLLPSTREEVNRWIEKDDMTLVHNYNSAVHETSASILATFLTVLCHERDPLHDFLAKCYQKIFKFSYLEINDMGPDLQNQVLHD